MKTKITPELYAKHMIENLKKLNITSTFNDIVKIAIFTVEQIKENLDFLEQEFFDYVEKELKQLKNDKQYTGYIVVIDDKEYKGKHVANNILRIVDLTIDDIYFFNNKIKKYKGTKKDCVVDIFFKSLLKEGLFKNCIFILDDESEFVDIIYDIKEIFDN